MVVAPQPEAVEAGAEAFRAGGNAVDAAVACALVQGVVDPLMTGIAGFGSLHLYLPGRGVHTFIDFHGRAPAATRPDMWTHLMEGETRDGFGFVLAGRVNDVGYQSITVPGSLRAYWEAQTEFGRRLEGRGAAAIAYAEAGFAVRPHLHQFCTQREQFGRADNVERLRHTPAGRRIFFGPDGELHALGSRMANPDLGRTLRRIAEGGVDVFYSGDMAREIAADMASHGGLLTLGDLATYRTARSAPLWGEYRGHRIATNRPPGGGVMLLEMLNTLESFDLCALGHNSPEYIRIVSEAMKARHHRQGSPRGRPGLRRRTPRPTHQQGLRPRDGRRHRARGSAPAWSALARARPPTPPRRDDRHGRQRGGHDPLAGHAFRRSHRRARFMYNGCMGVFDPRPGRAGSLAPGKSRFSSMCPSIVFAGDRPFLVIGAPGAAHIAIGVLQAILNVVDFDMSIADAVAALRFWPRATSSM